MKKLLLLILVAGISIPNFAQLTGTKNIPGDYSSYSDASKALNTSGSGPGGLFFNRISGNKETFAFTPAGLISASGTASDPKLSEKSGLVLNPLLTGWMGTNNPGPAARDGITANEAPLCSAVSVFPWSENFESLFIPAIPGCWLKPGGSWVTTNNSNSSMDANSLSGVQFLRESYGVTNDYIWSPGFALSGGTLYNFSFWWAGDGYSGWTGDVFYNTAQSSAGATQLGSSFVTAGTTTTKTYANVGKLFTPSMSGTYYFAIRVNATSNPWYLSFDDFNMERIETCPGPFLLYATPSIYESVLGWTEGSLATSWDIEWGPAGFAPGTGTLITGVTNPFTLTGLAPYTSYSYYVRSICGTNHSQWSGPYYFSTLCSVANIPIMENFESAIFPPACWSNVVVNGSNLWTRAISANGGFAEANFYNIPAGNVFDLKTLSFDLSAVTTPVFLQFDYSYATYSGEVDELDIYTSTDNGSTWVLLSAMPGGATGILNTGGSTTAYFDPPPSHPMRHRSLLLPSSAVNKVKFQAISAYGNNLYIDNIQVNEVEQARDVSVESFNFFDVMPLGTVVPTAVVKNYGAYNQTFPVTMSIGSYASTKNVVNLGPGASMNIVFDPWTNSTGNYTAVVSANLPGDNDISNNTLLKTFMVTDLSKTAFCYNANSGCGAEAEGPSSISLADPYTINTIADQGIMNVITDGTWAAGSWFGTEYDPAQTSAHLLLTIDTITGNRTLIGDIGTGMSGISYNPANQTLYGIAYDGTNSGLYSINMTTGAVTFVASCGTLQLVNLAINDSGIAYSVDNNSGMLGTIDLVSGNFTPIGPIGFDAVYVKGLEFDRDNNQLFMTTSYTNPGNSYPGLRLVNQTTGGTLVVGWFFCDEEMTALAIPYSETRKLNLKLFLQGLYTGGAQMRPAMDETGIHWGAGIADKITVELHDMNNYSNIIYTADNVNLNINGTATVTIPSGYAGSYYLTVKHRNSIETVSMIPMAFTSVTINCDFDLPSKVYGSNLLLTIDGQWVIYGGDLNQDGQIDTGDMTPVDNDATNYAAGYLDTDTNGDGVIDTGDMTIIDNNATSYVSAATP